MGRMRELYARAAEYLASRSARERRVLLLGAAAALVFIFGVAWISISSSIADREERIARKQQDLSAMARLAAGFAARNAEQQRLTQELRRPQVNLLGFLGQVTRDQGLTVRDMVPRAAATGPHGGVKETSVEVNLTHVTMDKLAALLKAIEGRGPTVKVKSLQVHKSFDDKTLLDVLITVSTWQLAT